jgi:putative membrane protein
LRRPPPTATPVAVGGLSALTVLAQIAYPLVPAAGRNRLTVAIVLLFAAASITHAAASRGMRPALAVVALTAGIGFGAEVLGVHRGFPFGTYRYTGGLGPALAGVPIVIAPAWTMFAWPAALVARRVVRSFPGRVAVGAWALTAWDLFLDPQMVAGGHWRWRFPAPHLPGVDIVPLTNYAGWLGVSLVISLGVQGILARYDRRDADDRWPYVLFLWTWLSSTLALAAFWRLAPAAAWGAAGLGLVAVPLLRRLAARR